MPKQFIETAGVFYFTKQLNKQMDLLLKYPCSIVEAPMGYGKTTAVREYLKSVDAHVLWLKAFDSSTVAFWSAFCRLIGKLDVDCSNRLAQLGFPNDSISDHEALRLIEGIEIPDKTAFVIDDYHLLNQIEVGRFIYLLIISGIDNLHIVLTARFIEYLSVEELSLKGYLCHITKETFELLPNDIVKYYSMCGIGLQGSDSEDLYASTKGWISALYLLMLDYKEKSSLVIPVNIYKLIDHAIYTPFSDKIKDFLLCLSSFDSFTLNQAIHMWGSEDAEMLLNEIISKNAFIGFDAALNVYQIHTIFLNFLKGLFEKKDKEYKKEILVKAGNWHKKNGEYLTAMRYYYRADDFDNLLSSVELDKARSFDNKQKEIVIKYFEECPQEIKQRHPVSLLVYAMALMTYNEMALFTKVCEEFTAMIKSGNLDADYGNRLMGEFELLHSFTYYNDIVKMSQCHKRACELLKEPSNFMDTTGSWSFGSPSVLYMFYRQSGKLDTEVQEMVEAMPYYYRLTKGHGTGAEYVMEAERLYNKGDFENAEIVVHKTLLLPDLESQPNMIICALFLQVRLAMIKGDYANILNLYEKMHEEIERNKYYELMHTIDMCIGFVNAFLKQSDQVPEWLAVGEFSSSRLYFPARAFYNIIYGRVLINRCDNLKLLGISDHFMGLASVFPNLLGQIYTNIYIAAANERIYRHEAARTALLLALDAAMPDKVYMPFVENCDCIKPILETISGRGDFREDIASILAMYGPYQKAVDQISTDYFTPKTPVLTDRETELARLAAEGFSNREIAERLFISENTVKTILKKVFNKLDINSRALLGQHLKQR